MHQSMEMSSVRLNSEQIADECNFINNFEMSSLEFDTLDEFTAEQYFQKDLSSGSYTSFLTMDQETSINNNTTMEISDRFEPPAKQIKTDNNTWNSSPNKHVSAKSSSSSSSSQLISFANFSSGPSEPQGSCGDLVSPVVVPKDEIYEELSQTYSDLYGSFDNNYSLKSGQGTKRSISTMARTPSHAQDHVIAERKRRERLTERFIALSAIVPDLKKLDKASVLGDAIKYLKQLQERVKLLEEELKKKKSEESVVSLNSSQRPTSDGSSSCDESSGGSLNKALPEIEARVSEKNVLIRIHCEKQKGFVSKLLSEIEKLHLTVINSSVLPFGNYAMDITIVAQMEAESSLTVKGLVRNLRSALK